MSMFEAGVLLIDKPEGPTSFNIVSRIRRLLGIKKVGHAGTLDPFATGLLIVCAGRPATRLISSFMDGEKEYIAKLFLGARTTTLDPEGEVIDENPFELITAEQIRSCLDEFRGEIMQKPPVYSALKHKGKPLYYYARKGIKVEKEPRRVTIHELTREDAATDVKGDNPYIQLRVVCSKGTYIRTLADDIGTRLGCGAYLKELRRTRSGPFTLDRAIDGDDLLDKEKKEQILEKVLTLEDVGKLLQ